MTTQPKQTPTKPAKAPAKSVTTKAPARRAESVAVSAAAPKAAPMAPGGKLGIVVDLLSRPGGAQIAELMSATGWQAHSVRGAIAGALKKGRGLTVISEKTEAGRVYRIDAGAPTGAAV